MCLSFSKILVYMRFVEGLSRDQTVSYMLEDLVEEDHYVRLIEEMANHFYQGNPGLFSDKGFAHTGRKAYHPAMLLGVWLYGYLNGISSSRKLERECKRNLELHWLCTGLVPDHKTLSDFRKHQAQSIQSFTRQFNGLLRQAGYIQGHTVAVDGSKLRAYVSQSYMVAALGDKLKDTDQKLMLYFEQLDRQDIEEDELATFVSSVMRCSVILKPWKLIGKFYSNASKKLKKSLLSASAPLMLKPGS